MQTTGITPNPWPKGPPVYETNPNLVPTGDRPDPDQKTINGIVIPDDEALRLSRIYAARRPIWTLYYSDCHPHKDLLIGRLYLSYPEKPVITPYILMGQTKADLDRILKFMEENFRQIPNQNEKVLTFTLQS